MGCILLSVSLSPPQITRFNPDYESIKVPEGRAAVEGEGGRREPSVTATPTQGLSVELLLGSSLLPSDGVLWLHQAELLVPPRGRRSKSGHHSPWGCAPRAEAKAPSWSLGKVGVPPLL